MTMMISLYLPALIIHIILLSFINVFGFGVIAHARKTRGL